MEKKSLAFLLTGTLAITIAVAVLYERIFVLQDFPIIAQMSCDPMQESCFVHMCDPEGEECTGDKSTDVSYYKMIEKKAANFPACAPGGEDCPEPTCELNEQGCRVIECTAESVADTPGDSCTNFAEFVRSHTDELSPPE